MPSEFYDRSDMHDLTEVDKAIQFIWYLYRQKEILEVQASEISELFEQVNLPRPNLSRLGRRLATDGRVIATKIGSVRKFRLHRNTILLFDQKFKDIFTAEPKPLAPLALALAKHADNLPNQATRAFVQEAVGCMNAGYWRAAIVLSWQGAFALIVAKIFDSHIREFSKEAMSKGFTRKNLEKIEQFQRMKESEILLCAESCGMISKAVKTELEICLSRRNNCGHPNDFNIGQAQVAGHIESLISHVYEKY